MNVRGQDAVEYSGVEVIAFSFKALVPLIQRKSMEIWDKFKIIDKFQYGVNDKP